MTLADAQESNALELDAADPLARARDRFVLPAGPDGRPMIYFNGNSLGLMPRDARAYVEREIEDWGRLGVDAHFKGRSPWYPYHELFRETGARLVGARPGEVVMMNSLTVNLHLLMATFYRPTRERHAILIEDAAFPSDRYAVESQVLWHRLDPARSVIIATPRTGEDTLCADDLEELIERRGLEIALVMLGGVHYFTGQVMDIPRLTRAAQRKGCVVGFDLAHAAGNVPLALHDAGVDFAAWCSYKYLNAGPGAVAGAFVHERHAADRDLVRLAGWWGNDPATRFRMHLNETFIPQPGAEGWQVSNPPILSMAPLRASLGIFDEIGMAALRAKSIRLTAYLQFLIDRIGSDKISTITPREPEARGCQISLRVLDRPRERFEALERAGVVADFRPPDVIRVAPVPLYNTFHEAWRFAAILARPEVSA